MTRISNQIFNQPVKIEHADFHNCVFNDKVEMSGSMVTNSNFHAGVELSQDDTLVRDIMGREFRIEYGQKRRIN